MIHLPFRFLSATNSQPQSVLQEASLSPVTKTGKKQQRINWVLGALSIGWAGLLIGCNSSTTVSTLGDWTKRSAFEGVGRSGASSFVINNIAYMGTGLDGSNQRLQDFWAYDPAKNAWTQKANYGGLARYSGVGFSIGNKGYIGTGINLNSDRLKDFWSYDPTTNLWVKVADFGGTARYGSLAFGIGNKGYVATGNDGNYLKDMWAFDPTANTWTKVASYGGEKRIGGVAFVIEGKAYAGTGNNNGIAQRDWYVYDPATDTWTQKLDFLTDQAVQRSYGIGFAINGKGYVTLGDNVAVWEYNPATDIWAQLGSFEGSPRQNAVGFAIGNKGYVTTGSASGTSRFDDLWDFDPTIEQVIN
ncbi:Kelch repeat-containing protein [Spirosoma fluviale]|uniref:Galactose oxidase, central domain n=1 Tax=Spirosoma fluviale TaxID=1597977 RepID=A0A286FHN7_9BACT|nr:kelch repeat-containing protein [Spirosoma fluviale]SOD82509.1 Galactose oxidase, central domain [Spirosoma fluviale]